MMQKQEVTSSWSVFLILAWRNAGYYGLDRFVLPAIGTPWHKGTVFQHDEVTAHGQLA
jgi:hypothetical protein